MADIDYLLNLPANLVWHMDNQRIDYRQKTPGHLKNFIDYIQVIKYANETLIKDEGDLLYTQRQIQLISDKVLLQGAKQQQALAKNCFLMRIVIIAYLWLKTGTTLRTSVNGFKDTLLSYGIENNQAARLKYLKLMQDGEEALQSLESYKAVAARYHLPKYANLYDPRNPILYEFRQAMLFHWQEARRLLKQGKTIENAEVMEQCDIVMQLGRLALELTIKHETAWASEVNLNTKEVNMVFQGEYSWIMDTTFNNFYLWLRSIPIYDPQGNRKKGAIDQPAIEDKFYEAHSRQNAWLEGYNATKDCLHREIDVARMLQRDERYYVQKDTRANFNKENPGPEARVIYGNNNDNEDYINNQIFSYAY